MRAFLGYHRAQVSAEIMSQHNNTGVYSKSYTKRGVTHRVSDVNLTVIEPQQGELKILRETRSTVRA